MHSKRHQVPTTVLLASSVVGFASASHAQAVRFDVEPKASAAVTDFEFVLPLEGTLIGDYDAKSNPGGTQTRPGLFGGSGNNPIGCGIDLRVQGDPTPTMPTGFVELDPTGVEDGAITITGLELDLLGGGAGAIGGELVIVYETFNTVNPFSIYPGGIEIPVPLDGATILRSEVALANVVPAAATEVRGGFTFDTLVPVIWTLEFDAGTGPQVQSIPASLPLSGSVLGDPGDRGLQLGGAVADAGSQPLDLPVGPIATPLPTIPPGGTANLLFSGQLLSVDFAIDLGLDLTAIEQASIDPADLNGDGRVDAADIGLLIAAWGPCDGCAADLDGNGLVDAGDLGLMIASWSF